MNPLIDVTVTPSVAIALSTQGLCHYRVKSDKGFGMVFGIVHKPMDSVMLGMVNRIKLQISRDDKIDLGMSIVTFMQRVQSKSRDLSHYFNQTSETTWDVLVFKRIGVHHMLYYGSLYLDEERNPQLDLLVQLLDIASRTDHNLLLKETDIPWYADKHDCSDYNRMLVYTTL